MEGILMPETVNWRVILVSIVLVALSQSCTQPSERVCVPGEVQRCPCPAGLDDGTQACSDEGTRWKACSCQLSNSDASDSDSASDTSEDAADSADATTDTADTTDVESGDMSTMDSDVDDVDALDGDSGDDECSIDVCDPTDKCPGVRLVTEIDGTNTTERSLQTAVRTTVQLDASGSLAPTNSDSELHFRWTVLAQPSTSVTSFLPDRYSAAPEILLDAVGSYTFLVEVSTDPGFENCVRKAEVDIAANAESDIHIELSWETPADPDPRDGIGTDFDLHYLHPNASGTWDSPPWDCHWDNRNPDWGNEGTDVDDPYLMIEDTDGAGPEIIIHDNPENVAYSLGVYYYSDRGMGPSDGTIRVYVDNALEFELSGTRLERTGDFWNVGYIEFDAGAFDNAEAIDTRSGGFP
jgi:hypothetical protein